jgi:dTMP kinase
MPPPPGKFIVLDGVEGCGKSTQARLLADWLQAHDTPVLLTHEPGATPVGAALRHLLLQADIKAGGQMTPLTETFLFCADRAEHVRTVIVPALLAGRWVICDRFSAATFAYQVWAGGVEQADFLALDETARTALKAVPGPETSRGRPDLTIILNLDPDEGMARKPEARDKIEQRSGVYHLSVQGGFLQYGRRVGGQVAVISADAAPEAVFAEILRALELEA